MGKNYISKRINLMETQRKSGRGGVSEADTRRFEIKLRFTDSEIKFFEGCAKVVGTNRAIYANAVVMDALIDSIAKSPRFFGHLKSEYKISGGDLTNPLFKEIERRMREYHKA